MQSTNNFRSPTRFACFGGILLMVVAACTREPGAQLPSPSVPADAPQLQQATDQTFEQQVLEHPAPVVVIMSTPWCPDCAKVKPDLKSLSVKLDGKVRFREVDTERNRFLAEKYEITHYPTLLLFVDGKVRARLVGAREAARLKQSLNTNLESVF